MGAEAARTCTIAFGLALLALVAGQASAVTINVDGHPADWGIELRPGGASDWEPVDGVQGTWGGDEDHVGDGYLGPGTGGQRYDAEALYFTYDGTYAYVGVVTGFRPDGWGCHRAGDIAINMLCDESWDFGIETRGGCGLLAGGLYATDSDDWKTPSHPSSYPSDLKWSSSLVWGPDDNLFYSSTAYGGEHYFIEAAIPLDELPLSATECTDLQLHWTMSCGNDVVDACVRVCPRHVPEEVIPEPATCTMLGGSLLAALALRVRRRKKS